MVETTSKPTDISKIQDIMNAINSNGGSDKTELKVDYAAGSKLESGINELKKIGKEQAGYLKKMVGYQDAMIGKARSESVSSVATDTPNEVPNKKSDSALVAAGSAALMSLLGPLAPILGSLASGLLGAVAGRAGKGNTTPNKNVDADTKPKTSDIEKMKADEAARKVKLSEADSKMARAKAEFINSERTGARLTGAAEASARAKAFRQAEELSRMADDITVPDTGIKGATATTGKVTSGKFVGKGIGVAGAALSAGMGYYDKELKDAGLNGMQRIGQGLLESIPSIIDMFVQGLVTDPLNTITGKGFAAEKDKFNLDITPSFRKFMLAKEAPIAETLNESNVMYGVDRDRQRISRNAPDLQVPSKTPTSQQAPIIIAPPAAPASSVVNSNNQQTTIINQTKDMSASLYSQMLGGNR